MPGSIADRPGFLTEANEANEFWPTLFLSPAGVLEAVPPYHPSQGSGGGVFSILEASPGAVPRRSGSTRWWFVQHLHTPQQLNGDSKPDGGLFSIKNRGLSKVSPLSFPEAGASLVDQKPFHCLHRQLFSDDADQTLIVSSELDLRELSVRVLLDPKAMESTVSIICWLFA